ncbi:MAG TPA: hypothetical protein VNB23_16885 [Ramlibacter sp.]|nr:hypothetical protein [Ramlibacter sp.]
MTEPREGPAPTQPRTDKPTGEPTADADPRAKEHDDWLLDEALRETFPASDPISPGSQRKG